MFQLEEYWLCHLLSLFCYRKKTSWHRFHKCIECHSSRPLLHGIICKNIRLFKSNINSNGGESLFPLIIGAGQGKALQEREAYTEPFASLAYSVRSLWSSLFAGISLNSTIFPSPKQGVGAHVSVINAWKDLRDLIGQARKQGNDGARANVLLVRVRRHVTQVILSIRRHVTQVIQSGIGAVYDTPYKMMIAYMLKVARETRESEPILLLTERNPQKWAAREWCRPINRHFSLPATIQTEPLILTIVSILDWILQKSFAYTDYKDSVKQEEYVPLLEKSMDRYQKGIRELKPAYDVNMFERKERIKSTVMVQSIWNGCQSRLLPKAEQELSQLQKLGGRKSKRVLGRRKDRKGSKVYINAGFFFVMMMHVCNAQCPSAIQSRCCFATKKKMASSNLPQTKAMRMPKRHLPPWISKWHGRTCEKGWERYYMHLVGEYGCDVYDTCCHNCLWVLSNWFVKWVEYS